MSSEEQVGVNEAKAPRWRMPLALGCGCLLLVAGAIATVVTLNWSSLSKAARGAAETLSELQGVQSAVLRKYGPAQVFVTAKRNSATPGSILSVRIVNAPSLAGLDGEAERLKALEIAAMSRAALKNPASYQYFEVVIGKQVKVGMTFNSNQAFMFKADELPRVAADDAAGDVR